MPTTTSTKDDVWIKTCCNMCFCGCAINVHRVNGVVVKIEGNPDSPVGEGHPCGKGNAGIMQLYDPMRKTKPMKRTNPKKGLDQDPGWVEISWNEAYTLAAQKLGEALSHPGKGMNIHHYSIVANMPGSMYRSLFFSGLLQTPGALMPDICGAGIHSVYSLLSGTGNCMPDYDYCKYLIQFGTQAGTATRHGFNMTVRRFADARVKNGMKLVVVDPHMSAGAEKADTWLPILPGTDPALALSIAHVLVHELGIYDREYLKKYTNAASLVDPSTRRILREKDTNKPYVWDLGDGRNKVFDDPGIKELALDGSYTIAGKTYETAFRMYADNLKRYKPEYVEEITTIPAAKIRQVAKEFGEAASIGSTITINGVELPYRPAVADCFSGVSRHKHAFLAHWAVLHLNLLIGGACFPGGLIGFGPVCDGFTEEYGLPRWQPGIWKEDNLIEHCGLLLVLQPESLYKAIREKIGPPTDTNLYPIMPLNEFDSMFTYITQLHPEKYKVHPGEVLFSYAGNPLKNWGNYEEMAAFMRSYKYIIGCDMYLNDSSYFYDLFLPEASYLERYDIPPNVHFNHHTIGGMSVPWTVSIRQPVISARDNCPGLIEILANIADKMGLTAHWNGLLNYVFGFAGHGAVLDKANLPMNRQATAEEVLDLFYKSIFGPEKGVDWFKKHGIIKKPRKVDETYILPRLKTRVPLYFDFMLEAKERIDKVVEDLKIPWETDDYQPLPEFKPCHDLKINDGGYDMLPIYWTSAINVDTWQVENPMINEINSQDPYGYNIEINSKTAREKGFKNGDDVILRASNGYEAKGRLICVEGVHPQVLAVGGGCWGTISKYQRTSKGRGIGINNLMTCTSPERLDYVSASYDQCVRVKIVRV